MEMQRISPRLGKCKPVVKRISLYLGSLFELKTTAEEAQQ
jgi:hypothetical protein